MQLRKSLLFCSLIFTITVSYKTVASHLNTSSSAQATADKNASAAADVKSSVDNSQCIECKKKPYGYGQGSIVYTKCCAKMICLGCARIKNLSKEKCNHCHAFPIETTSNPPVIIPHEKKAEAEETICVVCHEPQNNLTYTQCCGKILCIDCFASVIETPELQKNCPNCRTHPYVIRPSKPQKKIQCDANAAPPRQGFEGQVERPAVPMPQAFQMPQNDALQELMTPEKFVLWFILTMVISSIIKKMLHNLGV